MIYTLTNEEYKKELERVDLDNSVEQGLYFIIQLLLRSYINKDLWVTDTSLRTKSDTGKFDSVPDLMIFNKNQGISRKKSPEAIAVVEIKYLPWKRNTLDKYRNQAEGYIKGTNTVIYTNGVEWRFIYGENHKISNVKIISLGIDGDYYKICDEEKKLTKILWKKGNDFDLAWEELKKELNEIK